MRLKKGQLNKLREAMRRSIGAYADAFTDEQLNDFGMTMLEVTSVALKAKRTRLEEEDY